MIDKIVSLREHGYTWKEVSDVVGISPDAARGRYRRHMKAEKLKASIRGITMSSLGNIAKRIEEELDTENESDDIGEDSKQPEQEFQGWQTSFARIQEIQMEYNKRNRYSNSTKVVLPDKPILLVATSDWHIGLKSVDYHRLKSDINEWLEYDNAYVIINGDMIENGIGTQGIGSATEQVISPELQHLIAKDVVSSLSEKDKLLLVTQGNHEERSGRVLFETIRNIVDDKVAVFGNKGLIKIVVGQQTYNMFVGHKMPGGTDSNPFGAHLKVAKTYPGLDASIIGHVHTWNYGSVYYQGQYTHFATTGTYCQDEEYAVRFYNPIGGNINHYFVLNNRSNEIKHFNVFSEAVKFIEGGINK